MAVDAGFVEKLFGHLERGEADAFFQHVAEDVHWKVMGSHPLAGDYHDRETFRQSTFGRLQNVLRDGVRLRLTNLIVSGDTAVAELEALSTALDGRPFDNTYCWVMRFQGGLIVEVRAYLDSALVRDVIRENET